MLKYNLQWPDNAAPLQIEFAMIRRLYFKDKKALTQHYLNAHKLLWPRDDQNRWFVLGMTRLCEEDVTCFLGPASSNKTYLFVAHALIDFWVFPENSLAVISTTDIISLERKIWGRVKKLFNRARARFPWLGGYVLDSKRQITPYDIDDDTDVARALDCGIGTVACVSNGKFVGMGKFQGAKPPHSEGKFDGILKHYGDEAAVMESSFLDAYANWMVNNSGPMKFFKGSMAGNPTDISDPLCTASEPVNGWDSFVDTKVTQEWKSRWYNAHVVAFDGRDTPNNDEPKNQYPYLISSDFVAMMKKTHGENSWQYYQQAIGKPSRGMVSDRVITIGLCESHKAFDKAIWLGPPRTQIYHLDPAYGGGDRCIGGDSEFGLDKDGNEIFSCGEPDIIPILLNCGIEPPDQIARYVFERTQELGIPPKHIFYDSFGGGLLGAAFAKVFGFDCPVPVDSGARPTDRPVRFDLYVTDNDGGNRPVRRLKKCSEHYDRFITEEWFSTRELIESDQCKDLPITTAREGQLRMFRIGKGNKICVETKEELKERIGKSPDEYDWFAIGVEGARRLGFKIARIGRNVKVDESKKEDYFDTEAQAWDKAVKSGLLKH